MKSILIIGIAALIAIGGCKKKEEEVIPKAPPTLEVKFTNFPDKTDIRLDKNHTERIDYTATAGEGIKEIRANMVYYETGTSFTSSIIPLSKTSGFNSPNKDISVFNLTSPTYNEGIITITVIDVKGQTLSKILTINKNMRF